METYKDSVYSCKTGGTPANIDGDEGQEHHRAPGTGGIFNHSSLGRETVLNLSSIEVPKQSLDSSKLEGPPLKLENHN